MAMTEYASIADYIAAQPKSAQAALRKVRSTIRKALPSAKESEASRPKGRWEKNIMTRIAVALGLGALLVATGYAQQNGPLFTGKSVAMDGKDLSVARRSFEAGARSYWHSHSNGQLLLVEDGRMRTQKKGGPMKELGKGESDYTGPNVIHWHGAAPGQPLIQINVGFGGGTQWLNEVTDAEYNGK